MIFLNFFVKIIDKVFEVYKVVFFGNEYVVEMFYVVCIEGKGWRVVVVEDVRF